MLIFAHSGITLGAAALLTVKRGDKLTQFRNILSRWPVTLGKTIDIRILLIGSLLPDIIDKPLGQYFLRNTFSNGRIFSHTLLFLLIISATGFYIYKRHRKTWLLVLSFGTFMHLLLDQMWLNPRTLFWPIFGLAFDRADLTDWTRNILQSLFSKPEVYIPELIGLIILICFVFALFQRKNIWAFIKYGKV
ncbi:metal-dependent hydrolase [Chloroflexota bacterium]